MSQDLREPPLLNEATKDLTDELRAEISQVEAELHELTPFLQPALRVMCKLTKLTAKDIVEFNISIIRATIGFVLHKEGVPPEISKAIMSATKDILDPNQISDIIDERSKPLSEGLARFWERHGKPDFARQVRRVNGLET